MAFEQEKKSYMEGLFENDHTDKSRKGSVDEPIIPLLKTINGLPDYFTTSSCAGRIIFFVEADKRQDAIWLQYTHEQISQNEMAAGLEKAQACGHDVIFRQEACIIHVCCRTLESAQYLIDAAKFCGFKRSGIMGTTKRVMVELLNTERVETIIAKEGRLLIDTTYAEELRILANKRLARTREKMEKFRMHLIMDA